MVRAGFFLFAYHLLLLVFLFFPQTRTLLPFWPLFGQIYHPLWMCLGSQIFLICRLLCPSSNPARNLHSYLIFILSAQRPCCCQQHPSLSCRESEIFLNPAWSLILAHCHFDIALLPPWPVSYALPVICTLFATVLFSLHVFRFRFI